MSLESTENDKILTRQETSDEILNEFDHKYSIIDGLTPKNAPLSGQYKKSFAYYTFRQRLPNTLNTILKSLKDTKHTDGLPASTPDELNFVIEHIEQLKHQLETDGQLEIFKGNEPDKDVWNTFICNLPQDKATFYKACWLYAECYMYRKLASFFEATKTLKDYDYFGPQKLNALKLSTDVMDEVAKNTKITENNVQTFTRILKLNLWSNRCDLSITSGQEVRPIGNLFELIDSLNGNILIDDSDKIWNCLQKLTQQKESSIIVDFICDNAGFELFTDLLMAHYLIEHKLADAVRFNIKAIPWYVSDTTPNDVRCTLKYLEDYKSEHLNTLGKQWSKYFEDGKFQLATTEQFWTSPYEYYRMLEINPSLYKSLEESALIIFKGDLNYRKLLGDFNWDFTENFDTCLRGFRPSNLCTLRTVKGDLICGLKPGLAEELNKQKSDWMFTGEYGIIQLAEKF